MTTSATGEQKTGFFDLIKHIGDSAGVLYSNDRQTAYEIELARINAQAATTAATPVATGVDQLGRTLVPVNTSVNLVALGVGLTALLIAGGLVLFRPKGK